MNDQLQDDEFEFPDLVAEMLENRRAEEVEALHYTGTPVAAGDSVGHAETATVPLPPFDPALKPAEVWGWIGCGAGGVLLIEVIGLAILAAMTP